MKNNIKLSTGRIVAHRPYHNGATEAYIVGGGNMTNDEWAEYVTVVTPKHRMNLKPTQAEIKAKGI